MRFVTKDEIALALDRPAIEEDVPEWGGAVRLRVMSAEQRARFWAGFTEGRAAGDVDVAYQARLLVFCIVDEKGDPLFSEADAPALASKSGDVLNRLFEKAQELNGLTPKAVAAAGN